MYLYFSSNGTLKEIINDAAIRQGGSGIYEIRFFIEGAYPQVADETVNDEVVPVYQAITFQSGQRTFYYVEGNEIAPGSESFDITTSIMQIPYDKKRELKFFKYWTNYRMFKITIPSNLLNQNGTAACIIQMIIEAGTIVDGVPLEDDKILPLGPIIFNIEKTAEKCIIEPDTAINVAQWNYLISNMVTPATLSPLLDAKVDKLTTSGQYVYTHLGSTQGELSVSTPATGGSIPKRESDGRLKVATPLSDGDATTKKYVDDNLASKANDDDVVHIAGTETITGQKTFSAPIIVNGYSGNNGIVNLYYTYISTNSKTYFARVGVTTNQYVYYDLPFSYADILSQTHLTLAVIDRAQTFSGQQTFVHEDGIIIKKSSGADDLTTYGDGTIVNTKDDIRYILTIPQTNGTLTTQEYVVGYAYSKAETDSAISNAISSAIANVYKVQGTEMVGTLNSLPKSSSMNGYVYNIMNNGTLNNYSGTLDVVEGDNVLFVWNNGNWYWDKLASTVDLSGLVPKTTTIAGIALSGDILSSELTDALILANNTDIDNLF